MMYSKLQYDNLCNLINFEKLMKKFDLVKILTKLKIELKWIIMTFIVTKFYHYYFFHINEIGIPISSSSFGSDFVL